MSSMMLSDLTGDSSLEVYSKAGFLSFVEVTDVTAFIEKLSSLLSTTSRLELSLSNLSIVWCNQLSVYTFS